MKNFRISATIRQAMATQLAAQASFGTLEIYSTTRPTNLADSPGGVLLALFPFQIQAVVHKRFKQLME